MADVMKTRARRVAWVLILIADAGFVLWVAMAALMPDRLLGPGSVPIVTAGYEGFTKASWQGRAATSPMTAEYITLLFRLYGAFNVASGVMAIAIAITAFRRAETWAWWTLLVGNTIIFGLAMRYDWIVNAIGPFEMLEYLGLAMVYGALAVTVPFLKGRDTTDATSRH